MRTLIATLALGATLSAPTLAHSNTGFAAQPDLTRQQALERADTLFQTFDVNHDGAITRGEADEMGRKLLALRVATGRDSAPGIGGHTRRFLEHSFAGAQTVNRQQFEQAMLAHFDQMDLNHDGVVTAAERQQALQVQVDGGQQPDR